MNRVLCVTILVLWQSVFIWGEPSFAQEPGFVHRAGIEYAAQGKFTEAASWFKEHLKSNPSDSTSQSSLEVIKDLKANILTADYARSFFTGLDFFQNGKMGEGISELEKTIASNPGYPRPYNVMGVIYTALDDKNKAIAYFQKAISTNPQYSQACFNLAAVYQSLGQPEEALKYYEKVVVWEPDFTDAKINLAAVYASLGKYPEAIKYYQEAVALDRNNPEVYYNLALVYFISDQLRNFKDYLEKAHELYQRKQDAAGLAKVAEYMDKIKEIESKLKSSK